jgi:hypothetical protein
MQQDFQRQQQGLRPVHPHHHHGGGGASGQQGSQISSALNSLSTAAQAGNLSSAQTAFAALQQDLGAIQCGWQYRFDEWVELFFIPNERQRAERYSMRLTPLAANNPR